MIRIFFLFLILCGSSCLWAEFYADWEPTKIGAKKNKGEPHQRLFAKDQLQMRRDILNNAKTKAYRMDGGRAGHSHWMWYKNQNELLHPSSNEFSGALWAHVQGITGKGSIVAVMEGRGQDLYLKPDEKTKFLDVSKAGDDHAIHVADIVRQVAPDCHIQMWPVVTGFKSMEIYPIAINMSFGIFQAGKRDELAVKFIEGFRIFDSKTLFIAAAGNNGQTLSLEAPQGQDPVAPVAYHFAKDDEFRKNLILVGALTSDKKRFAQSSYPGVDRDIQNCFIWTLGEKVGGLIKKDIRTTESGTSLAAPIVTGAVALLKQRFPHFTAQIIREVILESTDRSFWRAEKTYIFNPEGSDAYRAVEKEKIESLKKAGVEIVEFDPSVNGKGILNIRNAVVYGKLKVHHKDWNVDQLRSAMLESLAKRDERAATVIQKKWRSYKERKKK